MNTDKIYAEAVANEYSVKDERRYVMPAKNKTNRGLTTYF